ncbi:hypothetical protein BIFANG_02204 [Bifidobacterium angulatum DSM 20098 = JCM 7096]|uniref:Uncharacterized protein n=1 Tax=Bifidobacterium angulatum DSM 20098 = JCM 7096 TaxID=518635 RepID=C4FD25_9BIFI|nr:hypothetical protein BIFANG_02204 [Bifidobacterium angulatum DSM 20098 = JCM 7096]
MLLKVRLMNTTVMPIYTLNLLRKHTKKIQLLIPEKPKTQAHAVRQHIPQASFLESQQEELVG